LLNKILILLFLLVFVVCSYARGTIIEFRNGDEKTIRRATFTEDVFFRRTGGNVKINPRKIYKMEIFADTIEIHSGETWLRAKIHPRGRGEEKPLPVSGWIKIGTTIRGNSDFGRISTALRELTRIQFRIPEPDPATNGNGINGERQRYTDGSQNGNGANGSANGEMQEQAQETENPNGNDGRNGNENGEN